jgi:hypothetical protein
MARNCGVSGALADAFEQVGVSDGVTRAVRVCSRKRLLIVGVANQTISE